MFALIFQILFNVLCSYKALTVLATAPYIESISTAIFFFFQLITYHWSFASFQNICIFVKMETCKISCRKVKISISLRGGNFQFSARGERYMYLKNKFTPGWNLSPGLIPPRVGVTCLLDLDLKSASINLLKFDWF